MSYRVGPPPPPWKRMLIVDYVASAAGAGVLLVAAAFGVQGGPWLSGTAALIAPLLLAISLAVLVHDLGRPARFWRMLSTLNPRSVLSWGAWILNACFGLSLLALGAGVFGAPLLVWRVLGLALLVVAPLVLVYKGMLLGVTAVPLWRTGRLFGPLLLADGISLGAAILGPAVDYRSTSSISAWYVVFGPMAIAAAARGLLMAAVFFWAGEDRRLLARGPIGIAFGASFLLSVGGCFLPWLFADTGLLPWRLATSATILASILLRAALLRAPYAAMVR